MSDREMQNLEQSPERASEAALAFAENLLMSVLGLALCLVLALT